MNIGRSLLRRPGHAALVVVTLSLTVGSVVIAIGVADAVWRRSSRVPDRDRLVMLLGDPNSPGAREPVVLAGLWAVQNQAAFVGVAGQVLAHGGTAAFRPRIVLDDVGREVETLGVTFEYFSVLGLTIRGRDLSRSDDRYGAEPVGIISDRLWAAAFGRRADVVGALVAARPFPIRIIGVAPRGFHGARLGEQADLWIPRNLVPRVAAIAESSVPEDAAPLIALARLRDGVTTAEAERLIRLGPVGASAHIQRLAASLNVVPLSGVFGTPDSRTIVVRERVVGQSLGILSGLVLLAGGVTLAGLTRLHYERRRRELTLRLVLGASRSRLAVWLGGELACLAAAGGTGAAVIAAWGLEALPALRLPGGVDLARLDLSADWRVLATAVVLSSAVLALAAAMSLGRFSSPALVRSLVATTVTDSASSLRFRRVLVAGHAAAAVAVLVIALLFVRAVVHGLKDGSGFDTSRTVFVVVQPEPPLVRPGEAGSAADRRVSAGRRLVEGLASLPGVSSVAVGPSPVGVDQASLLQHLSTVVVDDQRLDLRLGRIAASPDFLAVIGVPLVKGRALTSADVAVRPTPVVLTADLARRLWPTETALGQSVSIGRRSCTVVGIASEFRYGSLEAQAHGVVLTAAPMATGAELQFAIRTERPDSVALAAKRLIAEILPSAPLVSVTTGAEIMARDLGRQRLGAWGFAAFGFVALILGMMGVFGLVSISAELRRREFGVRLALGAAPRDLMWQALGAAIGPVAIGVALGLLAAGLVSRGMTPYLLGVSPHDPLTYAAVALLIVGCGAAAGCVAGWHLRSLPPLDALQHE